MKVTKIILNEKKEYPLFKGNVHDCCLYFFRSPVIFTVDNTEKVYSRSTAIICTGDREQCFRSTMTKSLKYDMVFFCFSSVDKQYVASMKVPFNVPIELNDSFIISSAIKSMKIYTDISRNRNDEFSELYMRTILILLESAYNSRDEYANLPKYPKLNSLREAIYENPTYEWSVNDICRRLSVSRTYFHRIYLDAFGITFGQDVIESRLVYATDLLENTSLSISAIAERCGYESDSYFMKQFKKHRGCTPTEYRRKISFEDSR
ncbi:MAG: AraC family transcriptional regulator [Ruminococcus sp.]|nr:AraC family transcriptional regulator [Ruminococcus sp.]